MPFRFFNVFVFLCLLVAACSTDDESESSTPITLDLESEPADRENVLSYLSRNESGEDVKVDIDSTGAVVRSTTLRNLLNLPLTGFPIVRGNYYSHISFTGEESSGLLISVSQVNMKNNKVFIGEEAITLRPDERWVDLVSTNNRLMVLSLTLETETSPAQNFIRIFNKTTGEVQELDLATGEIIKNYAIVDNYLIIQVLSEDTVSIVQSIDFVNGVITGSKGFDLPVTGTVVNGNLYIMGKGRTYEIYDPITFDLIGIETPTYLNFNDMGFFETSSSGNEVALDYWWAEPSIPDRSMVPVVVDLSSNELVVSEEVFLNYFNDWEEEAGGSIRITGCSVSLARNLVVVTYEDSTFPPSFFGLRYLTFETDSLMDDSSLALRPLQLFVD